MNTLESTIQHTKTYRYQLFQKQENISAVLYVLHGYGQLSNYFIRKFENLPDDLLIVAPEGMHRFYLKGSSGRVGASWMTKEMRECDIADNISWLSALDQEISTRFSPSNKFLLGFSQGGSTALRWKIHGVTKFNGLFIWASDFPPEEKSNSHLITGSTNHFFIGNDDEFYNHSAQTALSDYYSAIGFKSHLFLGGHEIDQELLRTTLEKISK